MDFDKAVEAVKLQLPLSGDRVGRKCGPGEFPGDFQGTVMTVYADRWYANNAAILWDDGTTSTLVGSYTQVGIGVYLLARKPIWSAA